MQSIETLVMDTEQLMLLQARVKQYQSLIDNATVADHHRLVLWRAAIARTVNAIENLKEKHSPVTNLQHAA